MKLKFFEKENDMWFICTIPSKRQYKEEELLFSEKIPFSITYKGKASIRKYAEQKARERIKKKKEIDKIGEYLGRSRFYPFSTKYGGVTLKGIMFSDNGHTLDVHLLEPYKGEEQVHYGMASAILSKKFLGGDIFGFSEDAIDSAVTLLIKIYQTEKSKEARREKITALARELNKK